MSAWDEYGTRDGTRSNVPDSAKDLEEEYWDALLSEGEYTHTTATSGEIDHLLNEGNGNGNHSSDYQASTLGAAHGIYQDDWDAIEQKMENDEILALKVIGYNRGGLLVEWRSLRGFVPASQLVDFPAEVEQHNRRDALVQRVGNILSLRVIELNPEKNRLILSERAAQVSAGQRANLLHTLQIGDMIEGGITNLCDFGAFVDLGGVEGLIHISELSWGRVGHPADMLRRGQNVKVYVLDIHPEEGRIALSLKRLRPDPWVSVEQRYQVGEIVEGRITNVVDFGAFACIEDGLEGLIHFSELAEGHFLHPRNVVQEGEIVQARILSINGRERRLGLSLRLI